MEEGKGGVGGTSLAVGPMVKTPRSQCREHGFDPACHKEGPEKKKRKKRRGRT